MDIFSSSKKGCIVANHQKQFFTLAYSHIQNALQSKIGSNNAYIKKSVTLLASLFYIASIESCFSAGSKLLSCLQLLDHVDSLLFFQILRNRKWVHFGRVILPLFFKYIVAMEETNTNLLTIELQCILNDQDLDVIGILPTHLLNNGFVSLRKDSVIVRHLHLKLNQNFHFTNSKHIEDAMIFLRAIKKIDLGDLNSQFTLMYESVIKAIVTCGSEIVVVGSFSSNMRYLLGCILGELMEVWAYRARLQKNFDPLIDAFRRIYDVLPLVATSPIAMSGLSSCVYTIKQR